MQDVIEVMLGTSDRIGEALALRKCDVDDTVSPMQVTVSGTLVVIKGRGVYRQDHPKTATLIVTVTRAGTTEQLSTADFAVTGFDSATPGDRTVTVSIRSGLPATNGAAVSTTFTARVLPV